MTLYRCSLCDGVHDSSEPSCASVTVRPIGIGTHNPALVTTVSDLERLRGTITSISHELDLWEADDNPENMKRLIDRLRWMLARNG